MVVSPYEADESISQPDLCNPEGHQVQNFTIPNGDYCNRLAFRLRHKDGLDPLQR